MDQPGGAPTGESVRYPLNLERVLGLTFSLLRFRWRGFVAVSLAVGLPVFVLVALLQVAIGDDLARFQQAQLDIAEGRPVSLGELVPLSALAVTFLAITVAGVGGYLTQAAVIALAAGTYAAKPATIRYAFAATARHWLALIAAAAVMFVVIFATLFVGGFAGVGLFLTTLGRGPGAFGGLLAIVTAGALVIFLTVRWSLVAQVVMLEDLPAVAALRRSWRLVAGSSWRMLGYTILFAIMVGGIGLLVDTFSAVFLGTGLRLVSGQLVFEPVPYLVGTLISAVVSLALAPISIIGLTLLYFDLRHRRGEPPLPSLPKEQLQPDL